MLVGEVQEGFGRGAHVDDIVIVVVATADAIIVIVVVTADDAIVVIVNGDVFA